MKQIRLLACSILAVIGSTLCCALFAQIPAFEVASIKPAPPLQTLITEIQSGKRGIGSIQTTIDDARVDFGYMPLDNMLMYAYKMKAHQIVGPDWLASQAFEIHARIPKGVSKDQVPEMMQSLLAERFGLTVHRENREQPVYALVVSKDGHKLKEAVADAEVPASAGDSTGAPPADKNDGKGNLLSMKTPEGQVDIRQEGSGMVMNGGSTGQIRMSMDGTGAIFYEIARLTMANFADLLTQFVDLPVMDMTGLEGFYQVSLEIPKEELLTIAQRMLPKMGMPLPAGISGAGALIGAAPGAGGLAASDPSGGGIMQAVQKLGLKLDSRKVPMETLIVDHIEKTPTEN
jgi:uncharacterized protein (TIGR03435 family)